MADAFGLPFISISAVLGGVKDIRDAVEKATANRERTGRSTVVFVDEVHRFSKSQQDAFLPHVESGLFTFIGATTENPSFEVISALLSRSTVYVLESLKDEDLKELLERALEREYTGLKVNEEAEKILIGLSTALLRLRPLPPRLMVAVFIIATPVSCFFYLLLPIFDGGDLIVNGIQ